MIDEADCDGDSEFNQDEVLRITKKNDLYSCQWETDQIFFWEAAEV